MLQIVERTANQLYDSTRPENIQGYPPVCIDDAGSFTKLPMDCVLI